MEEFKFLSGDIGVSSGDHFVATGIGFFTSWKGNSSDAQHAYAYVESEWLVEALWRVSLNHASKYDNQNTVVFRIPLTDEDRENFRIGMLRAVNSGYGILKIPLFALDGVATKIAALFGRKQPVFFFTKYFGISHFKVCSQLVVWGIHKFTSYRLMDGEWDIVDWKVVSPDYLHDLLKNPINKAEVVYVETRKEGPAGPEVKPA